MNTVKHIRKYIFQMSQTEFARHIGTSQCVISKIESTCYVPDNIKDIIDKKGQEICNSRGEKWPGIISKPNIPKNIRSKIFRMDKNEFASFIGVEARDIILWEYKNIIPYEYQLIIRDKGKSVCQERGQQWDDSVFFE